MQPVNSIILSRLFSILPTRISVITAVMAAVFLNPILTATQGKATTHQQGQSVLMVEISPALCKLSPRSHAQLAQCTGHYPVTINALDVFAPNTCPDTSILNLSPVQNKVLSRVMPDVFSQTLAWQKYGRCSGLSSSDYFRQITNKAQNLKFPKELSTGNSYTVKTINFVKQLLALNKGLEPNNVVLICTPNKTQNILTQVNVCYQDDKYSACLNKKSNCGSTFVIAGK